MANETTPRIYVACLACYNEGKLHGEWIDATQDADAIGEAVTELQAKCGHTDNDHAIHDTDGFYSIRISEYESFAKVSELAQAIDEHGAAFAAYVDNIGAEYADVDGFNEAYLGEYDSLEAYAQEYLDSTGELECLPESLRYYFDYEAYGRDLQYGGDVWTADAPGYKLFIYRNN